jgi:NAD(P)-dependent dehydrogenase (short-subunit alcohol dehydrogenase family)
LIASGTIVALKRGNGGRNMKTLETKNAVITGGSEGIGYAIATAFARQGANLLLVARNQEKLGRARAELSALGSRVETLPWICLQQMRSPTSLRKFVVSSRRSMCWSTMPQ